jgi:hypothetical protein
MKGLFLCLNRGKNLMYSMFFDTLLSTKFNSCSLIYLELLWKLLGVLFIHVKKLKINSMHFIIV